MIVELIYRSILKAIFKPIINVSLKLGKKALYKRFPQLEAEEKEEYETYKKKADTGDPKKEYDFAYFLLLKENKKDTRLAIEYIKKSAEHGYKDAETLLESINANNDYHVRETYPEYYWIDWVRECKSLEDAYSAKVKVKTHGLIKKFSKVDVTILVKNRMGGTIKTKNYSFDMYSPAMGACNGKVYDLTQEEIGDEKEDKKKLGCSWWLFVIVIFCIILFVIGEFL